MIDTNKLYKMIKVMGKMDLKSLSERFPDETMDSMRAIIGKTDNLEIVGSFVRIKETTKGKLLDNSQVTTSVDEEIKIPISTENVTIKGEKGQAIEQKVMETTEEEALNITNITASGEAYASITSSNVTAHINQTINTVGPRVPNFKNNGNANIIQLRDVSKKTYKVESELTYDKTYDKIMDLIMQYNENVENKLNELMGNFESRNQESVYNYLSERYIIEPYKRYPNVNIYSQFDKQTNMMRGYAVIVQDLTEDVFMLIDSLFDMDMVFVYYINENYVGVPNTTKEIYIRPTEAIIKQYTVDYEIQKVKIPAELSRIVRSDNGEPVEL